MSCAELIVELQARGIQLRAAGDRLRYCPVEAVDADLLDAMRQHKRDLLKWAVLVGWFHENWPGPLIVSAMVN